MEQEVMKLRLTLRRLVDVNNSDVKSLLDVAGGGGEAQVHTVEADSLMIYRAV